MLGWIDLAGVGLLGVFVGIGAMRGFVAGLMGVIALVLAYAAGYVSAVWLSDPLAASLALEPLAATAIAGVGAFAGVYVLLSALFSVWLRGRRRRLQHMSGADRLGGALLGGAQGALIGILLYWLVGQAQAGGLLGEEPEPSPLVRASQSVVHSGAQAVLGGEGGHPLAARVVADPVGVAKELEAVLETPSMAELQGDALFWQYVSSGAIDSALNQASFMRAASDAELRRRIVELGVMPEEARDDPRAFRSASREALEQVAPRLAAIRNDPVLPELASDPEVRAALESGNLLGLAAHPKVRALVTRALAADPAPPAAPQ
jgi:uncharacterized membrane protein required for colicin V production